MVREDHDNLPAADRHHHALAPRIVTTARRHFLTHGFRRTTMDDLAHELGMSKKTLYGCFHSKEALVKAVLHEKLRAVEGDLHRITTRCHDVPAALHQLLVCVERHTGEIHPVFVRDIGRETPELFKLVETRRRTIIRRYFGRLLEQGRRAGLIRRDVAAKLIVEILLGATQAIMNPARMEELRLSPRAGYIKILRVVLEGALAHGRTGAPRKHPRGQRPRRRVR